MNELIINEPHYTLKRNGRFLIAHLITPHQVLSTSACDGGLQKNISYLVNHQSCEGSGHNTRFELIKKLGEDGYHQTVCAELDLDSETVALMGTAANMNYAAHAIESYQELSVCAVVTAGVEGNAGCAGDPASWHESDAEWVKSHPHEGTINTMLLINWPVTPGALARAVITMTEAKSAALQALAISSRYSQNLATGTGTDQYCIASSLDNQRKPKTNTGHHAKLGELIGKSVYKATLEALRWQNGLETSYTRSIIHALQRFGLKEDTFLTAMEIRLDPKNFELLKKNLKPILYEPQVSAAAFAFAAVWDRVRFGTISPTLAAPVLRQQAATLATSLAAKPDAWQQCWQQLVVNEDAFLETVYDALALGWQLKWT